LRSPERGLPFPFVYSSSSFHKSSPISKFEKAFEAITKNEGDYTKTLRRYSFRRPQKKAGRNEQVNPISIFDYEGKRRFATKTRSTITSIRTYLGLNSKESSNSQHEVHKKNKSTSNGYKFAWEEGVDSP
jgi:hypothetical protein